MLQATGCLWNCTIKPFSFCVVVIIISDDEDTIPTSNEVSTPKETNLSSVSHFVESDNKNDCVKKEIPVSLDDGLFASSHQLQTEYALSDSGQNITSKEACLPIYKNSSELKRTSINEQLLNEKPKKKRKSLKNQRVETGKGIYYRFSYCLISFLIYYYLYCRTSLPYNHHWRIHKFLVMGIFFENVEIDLLCFIKFSKDFCCVKSLLNEYLLFV